LPISCSKGGFGTLPLDVYIKAEAAISTALKKAERDGYWRIASDDASSLEKILAAPDEQLGNAPLYHIVKAEKRLRAFFTG